MPTKTRPALILSALTILAVQSAAASSASSHPVSAPVVLSPAVAAEYVRPHTLVDIGRRKLNLFCMGSGPVTVLFESGVSDWSVTWALVQPAVARSARACSYDRAGMGYSDSERGPRSPFAVADDLHKLIQASGITQPLILVGHSLGGFNMKLYSALWPEGVAGLILIDPAEERDSDRSRAFITQGWGRKVAAQSELSGQRFLSGLINRYQVCAENAERAPLDPESIDYRRCTDPVRPALGPIIASERSVLQRTGRYQRAQASEIAFSIYGDARPNEAYANLFKPGLLGGKPLIVMTVKEEDATDPMEAADLAAGDRLHGETALLSTAGCVEPVTDTSHNIQIDRPDVIINAVNRMIKQVSKAQTGRQKLSLRGQAGSLGRPLVGRAAAPRCVIR